MAQPVPEHRPSLLRDAAATVLLELALRWITGHWLPLVIGCVAGMILIWDYSPQIANQLRAMFGEREHGSPPKGIRMISTIIMVVSVLTFSGGAILHAYFSNTTIANGAKSPESPHLPDTATTPVAVTSTNQSGGFTGYQSATTINNYNAPITNVYGPPERRISAKQESVIVKELKALGPHAFSIVDYTGGTDVEAHKYLLRISAILIAGGWKQISDNPGWFQPVGGGPMMGVHFIFHSDAVPNGAAELARILGANGVSIVSDYLKFPMFAPSDDVIGLAIGRAPQ